MQVNRLHYKLLDVPGIATVRSLSGNSGQSICTGKTTAQCLEFISHCMKNPNVAYRGYGETAHKEVEFINQCSYIVDKLGLDLFIRPSANKMMYKLYIDVDVDAAIKYYLEEETL